jgi:hypothetical protein
MLTPTLSFASCLTLTFMHPPTLLRSYPRLCVLLAYLHSHICILIYHTHSTLPSPSPLPQNMSKGMQNGVSLYHTCHIFLPPHFKCKIRIHFTTLSTHSFFQIKNSVVLRHDPWHTFHPLALGASLGYKTYTPLHPYLFPISHASL